MDIITTFCIYCKHQSQGKLYDELKQKHSLSIYVSELHSDASFRMIIF